MPVSLVHALVFVFVAYLLIETIIKSFISQICEVMCLLTVRQQRVHSQSGGNILL
jgi:hypothetical protein